MGLGTYEPQSGTGKGGARRLGMSKMGKWELTGAILGMNRDPPNSPLRSSSEGWV